MQGNCRVIYASNVISDSEVTTTQQQHLNWLSNRTLSLPLGRGLFTFRTKIPIATERFPVPDICLSARLSPTNVLVELDVAHLSSTFRDWSEFHNGAAAGLRLTENCAHIDASWISFNQSLSNDSTAIFDNKHAGFLLGLGLNGYLRRLKAFDLYNYLISKDNITAVGLSLGLAASYVESKDPQIMKLLSIHVQGMLPPGSAPLNISITTQTSSLLGLGLVFMGSLNRKMAECTLKVLTHDQTEMAQDANAEAYTLAAGLALVFFK